MFVLVVLRDTVQVQPHNFGKDLSASINEALGAKFCNRVHRAALLRCIATCRGELNALSLLPTVAQVLENVGLVIALYDFQKVSEAMLLPGAWRGSSPGIQHSAATARVCGSFAGRVPAML